MLKKTFYIILAIGAIITVGMLSSGFTGTNKTTAEAETPVAGTWIAGDVNSDGTVRNAGTGDWTVKKLIGTDYYEVQGPANAKIMVATSNEPHPDYDPDAQYYYLHNRSFPTVESMGNGIFRVRVLRLYKNSTYLVLPRNLGFSFVMYSK